MDPRARLVLLTDLAWNLRELMCTSTVVLPRSGGPVLYAYRPDGSKISVVTLPRDRGWWFIWGRGGWASAEFPELAARRIAGATAA